MASRALYNRQRPPGTSPLSGDAMTSRILLVDDHKLFREGMRSLLEEQASMTVVGQAGDGREGIALAGQLKPDVVIMDVAMPGMNGVEATRKICAMEHGPRVLALSMHADRRFAGEMLEAGAAGYLIKDAAVDELVRAIQTVTHGRVYLTPLVAGLVINNYVRQPPPQTDSAFSVLTPREREVLQLLAEGLATKEVAGRLDVSVKTVETHRAQIMKKLDLHSIAELTKYAVREGLTSLED